jgi:hypothetical protein
VVGSLQSTWVGPLDRRGEGQKTTTLVSAMSTTGESIYACGKGQSVNGSRPWGWCVPIAASVHGALWTTIVPYYEWATCVSDLFLLSCVCVRWNFPGGQGKVILGCDAKISREGSDKVVGLINQYVCNDGESPCRAANAFIACRRKGG